MLLDTRLINRNQFLVQHSYYSLFTNLKIQSLKDIYTSNKYYMKFINKPNRKGIDLHLGNPTISRLEFYTKETHFRHKAIHTSIFTSALIITQKIELVGRINNKLIYSYTGILYNSLNENI